MSSELKVTNIKHESSGSNNLVLASDGNVSITNTLSAGTIGGNVVFPSNHVIAHKIAQVFPSGDIGTASTTYVEVDSGLRITHTAKSASNIILFRLFTSSAYTGHTSFYVSVGESANYATDLLKNGRVMAQFYTNGNYFPFNGTGILGTTVASEKTYSPTFKSANGSHAEEIYYTGGSGNIIFELLEITPD